VLPGLFRVVRQGERLVGGVLFDAAGRQDLGSLHTPMFLLRETGEAVLTPEVRGAFEMRYEAESTPSPGGVADSFFKDGTRRGVKPTGYLLPAPAGAGANAQAFTPLFRITSMSRAPYKQVWPAWRQSFGRGCPWPRLQGLPQPSGRPAHKASEEETVVALVLLYAAFLWQFVSSGAAESFSAESLLKAAHLEFHPDRWRTFDARYPYLTRVVRHYHEQFREEAKDAAMQEARTGTLDRQRTLRRREEGDALAAELKRCGLFA
jgi:hypothetical protein